MRLCFLRVAVLCVEPERCCQRRFRFCVWHWWPGELGMILATKTGFIFLALRLDSSRGGGYIDVVAVILSNEVIVLLVLFPSTTGRQGGVLLTWCFSSVVVLLLHPCSGDVRWLSPPSSLRLVT